MFVVINALLFSKNICNFSVSLASNNNGTGKKYSIVEIASTLCSVS